MIACGSGIAHEIVNIDRHAPDHRDKHRASMTNGTFVVVSARIMLAFQQPTLAP